MKKLKSSDPGKKYRITIISILLAISCFFIYYFHEGYEIHRVFLQFFYIPIILASFWWKRKGLPVALFLIVFFIFSHIFFKENVVTANDFFRSILLLFIACMVAFLSERIAETEKKLKKSEEMYKNTIKFLPLHLGVTNPEGKYIIWNDYSENMLGYSSDEAIKDLTLNKLVKDPEKTANIFSSALKQGIYDEYVDLIHKNGRIIPTQLKIVPVYQSDSILSGFIIVAEDLTQIENSRKRIKKLSKELSESQEDERRKISAEIHDEAGVTITSLQLNCSMIKELISIKRYHEIEPFIDSIIDTSKNLSSELRKVCYNLAPANIKQDGIIYAISDYLEKIKAYAELEIDSKISREIENSDIVIKTTLYRTIQEAVTNVIRHSNAKNLTLSITKRKNDINLKIADNGIGFDMSTTKKDKYGLKGIRSRVENLGGSFKIGSKPASGTSIEVQLPYI